MREVMRYPERLTVAEFADLAQVNVNMVLRVMAGLSRPATVETVLMQAEAERLARFMEARG